MRKLELPLDTHLQPEDLSVYKQNRYYEAAGKYRFRAVGAFAMVAAIFPSAFLGLDTDFVKNHASFLYANKVLISSLTTLLFSIVLSPRVGKNLSLSYEAERKAIAISTIRELRAIEKVENERRKQTPSPK